MVHDVAAVPRPSSRAAAAIAAAGLAGGTCAFVVALAGGYSGYPGLVASGRALGVLIRMGVGLHQGRPRGPPVYPALLVLLGLVMVPATLSESHDPVLYSAGRIAAWTAEY